MEHAQQQLEPAQTPKVAVEAEPAVPVGPAVAPESAVPTGARAPEDLSALSAALGATGSEQRERYVLQLQRTAGNAAVSRWLAAVGERYARRTAAGGEPPAEPDAARPR